MRWWWLAVLTAAAAIDWKTRKLPVWLMVLGTVPGLWNFFDSGPMLHGPALLAGMGLVFLSRLTEGALGEGDGLFFFFFACYLTLPEVLALLAGGLAVSSIWGIWLWSKCLRNQRGNPQTIPFLTCLWPAGCILILGG